MPEIRLNPITGDWVIIATERSKRPQDFAAGGQRPDPPPFRDDCPFCPGNEDQTPEEIIRVSGSGRWQVRVVPNKYAALSIEGEVRPKTEGLRSSFPGVGHHEVIIESSRHDTPTALLPVDHIRSVFKVGLERYRAIQEDPRVRQVVLFKNHGETAGTSLEHPHLQIVGTPVVSAQITLRYDRALRYGDERGECMFCRVLEDELEEGTRIVAANSDYVAFVPYAALSPFHLWIFPRSHRPSFGGVADSEIPSLAGMVKLVLAKLHWGLKNPDYNLIFRSLPGSDPKRDFFHWYITVLPRVSKVAGFELGSGIFINPSLPEDSARLLREIELPGR